MKSIRKLLDDKTKPLVIPGEHATSFVSERKEKKRIRKEIVSYLESHIEIMRKKLSVKK